MKMVDNSHDGEIDLDLLRGALQFLWKLSPFPHLRHLNLVFYPNLYQYRYRLQMSVTVVILLPGTRKIRCQYSEAAVLALSTLSSETFVLFIFTFGFYNPTSGTNCKKKRNNLFTFLKML